MQFGNMHFDSDITYKLIHICLVTHIHTGLLYVTGYLLSRYVCVCPCVCPHGKEKSRYHTLSRTVKYEQGGVSPLTEVNTSNTIILR